MEIGLNISFIAYYRPIHLRERNVSVLADLTPEGMARLAHAHPASFQDQRVKAARKPYMELDEGDVETIISDTLAIPNYAIAQGWDRNAIISSTSLLTT